jgi:hypothetical protein
MENTSALPAPITAIPTTYKGIQMRSRMEAQVAFLLDQISWPSEYEGESIMLSNGVSYTPDFHLTERSVVIECRGYEDERGAKQIAGFIADLHQRAIATDDEFTYIVMGPSACTVYTCDVDGKRDTYPMAITFCPRCDEWHIDTIRERWSDHALCPACVELTFNSYAVTVAGGKFGINGVSLDDCVVGVFDREIQHTGWFCNLCEHVYNTLGVYGGDHALTDVLLRLCPKKKDTR